MKIDENSRVKVCEEEREKYVNEANLYWNKFYDIHQNKFFKDRNWLFTEFDELLDASRDLNKRLVFELGCGVGNTIFPLLNTNKYLNRSLSTMNETN